MSRLTGADAYGLMEAYQAVYAPQELTEEQAWEEVETWVNDLIEEGYDLSDYTWEEMYESYLSEFSGNLIGDLKANAGNIARGVSGAYQGAMQAGSRVNQAVSDRMQRNIKPITTPKPSPRTFQNDSGGSAGFGRYAEPTQFTTPTPKKTPAPTTNTRTPSRLTPGVTTVPIRPRTPAPASGAPARTTPPARPTATAPAGPKPAMGPTGKPLVGGIERRTPTSAELKAAQAARAGGGALAQATAAASKPAAFSPTPAAATPTPAARPATPARPTPRQTRLNMEMEYDTFDTVLEYLVSEGYADTEESALVIMANMSEEWRQSIVEDNSTGATKTVGGQTFRDYNSDGLSDRQKRIK